MSRWAAVTFGRRADRGALGLALVGRLREHGVAVAGFVQEELASAEPKTVELVRLGAPGRTLLGSHTPRRRDGAACAFAFDPHAFEAGRGWLEADAPAADVLFLHELSKLELEGQGHAAAFTWALGRPGDQLVVFCARAERLGPLVERFPLAGEPVAYLEHHAAGADPERFAAELAAAVGLGACGHE